jgi:predicted unusual protein kinase regulating ubiquinone biosynthesis (AarF/ABC1/UbiB family)
MSAYGVIHGDPHLGNYAVGEGGGSGDGSGDSSVLNLLDFGCIRIFPPAFVEGVVGLYRALGRDDRAGQRAAYEAWGFGALSEELLDALNLWARFIYGPILDDRERTVADGVKPGHYGRREAFAVRERLKALGPVTIPREFVFMDRAAIGLGAAFLHLDAKLNFHALFESAIEGFDVAALAARQAEALADVGLGA